MPIRENIVSRGIEQKKNLSAFGVENLELPVAVVIALTG